MSLVLGSGVDIYSSSVCVLFLDPGVLLDSGVDVWFDGWVGGWMDGYVILGRRFTGARESSPSALCCASSALCILNGKKKGGGVRLRR